MSLSLGGLLGLSAGASGASSAGSLLNDVIGSWATSSAKQSLNKAITKTNLKVQKEYDEWTQQKDKEYEQWWQRYLYDLQDNEYYNLARKYAENTASWAVRGLKKAGLNPILAGIDSNLSSSMGSAGPQSSGHGSSKGSIPTGGISGYRGSGFNFAQALQSASAMNISHEEAKQKEVQTDVLKDTKPAQIDVAVSAADKARADVENSRLTGSQIEANTAESVARANLIQAQARKTTVEAANEAKNYGLGGLVGSFFRLSHELFNLDSDKDFLRKSILNAYGVDEQGHSAKSSIPPIRVQKEEDMPYYYPEYREYSKNQYEFWRRWHRDPLEPTKVREVKRLPPPRKKFH